MTTYFVAAERKEELEELIRSLPEILAGKVADQFGIARGFKLRCAFMFFSLVKEAFIIKSRGGTDDCGIKWPPLSPEYLAYTRPMGKNGQGSRSPPHAGGLAPGKPGNDGFMTAADLKIWKMDFRRSMAYLSLQLPLGEAKAKSASIAWARAKRRGVKTKLEVFGHRDVEILRDRGILFNSLSPGILAEQKTDATYQPGSPDQVVKSDIPGILFVGTSVEYAEYHQVNPGKRPLWPKDGNLPQIWQDDILEIAISGLIKIGDLFI